MLVIVIVIFGLVIIEKVSSPKCDEKGHNFAHHTYISGYKCKFCHYCLRIQTQIDLLKNGVKDVDLIIVSMMYSTPFLQSKRPLTALEISKSKEH